jgi:hypothetical protein
MFHNDHKTENRKPGVITTSGACAACTITKRQRWWDKKITRTKEQSTVLVWQQSLSPWKRVLAQKLQSWWKRVAFCVNWKTCVDCPRTMHDAGSTSSLHFSAHHLYAKKLHQTPTILPLDSEWQEKLSVAEEEKALLCELCGLMILCVVLLSFRFILVDVSDERSRVPCALFLLRFWVFGFQFCCRCGRFNP